MIEKENRERNGYIRAAQGKIEKLSNSRGRQKVQEHD
jgi:hypothetical protein